MPQDTNDIAETLNLILTRMATREDIAEIRAEMATKEDFTNLRAEMKAEFASIRAETQTIRGRLDDIETLVQNLAGITKEIDYVMEQQSILSERVSAIEKHLGIQRNVAA